MARNVAADDLDSWKHYGEGLARCLSVDFDDDDPAVKARLLPIPDSFICPISTAVMDNPTSTVDGCIYERQYIEQWIRECRQHRRPVTSPSTGKELTSLKLLPVEALKKAIETYMGLRPELKLTRMLGRSCEEAARVLQEELLEKQTMHQSVEDEIERLRFRLEKTEESNETLQQEVMELRSQLEGARATQEQLSADLVKQTSVSTSLLKELELVKASASQTSEDRTVKPTAESIPQWDSNMGGHSSQEDEQCAADKAPHIIQLSDEMVLQEDKVDLHASAATADIGEMTVQEVDKEHGNRMLQQPALASEPEAEYQKELQRQISSGIVGDDAACKSADIPSEGKAYVESYSGFKRGDGVLLAGLKRSELNGLQGTLVRFETACGRWHVLLSTKEMLRIRPENIRKAQHVAKIIDRCNHDSSLAKSEEKHENRSRVQRCGGLIFFASASVDDAPAEIRFKLHALLSDPSAHFQLFNEGLLDYLMEILVMPSKTDWAVATLHILCEADYIPTHRAILQQGFTPQLCTCLNSGIQVKLVCDIFIMIVDDDEACSCMVSHISEEGIGHLGKLFMSPLNNDDPASSAAFLVRWVARLGTEYQAQCIWNSIDVQRIVGFLHHPVLHLRCYAADIVAPFAGKHAEAMIRVGILPPLISMLKSSNFVEASSAIWALNRLACSSSISTVVKALRESNLLPWLEGEKYSGTRTDFWVRECEELLWKVAEASQMRA